MVRNTLAARAPSRTRLRSKTSPKAPAIAVLKGEEKGRGRGKGGKGKRKRREGRRGQKGAGGQEGMGERGKGREKRREEEEGGKNCVSSFSSLMRQCPCKVCVEELFCPPPRRKHHVGPTIPPMARSFAKFSGKHARWSKGSVLCASKVNKLQNKPLFRGEKKYIKVVSPILKCNSVQTTKPNAMANRRCLRLRFCWLCAYIHRVHTKSKPNVIFYYNFNIVCTFPSNLACRYNNEC